MAEVTLRYINIKRDRHGAAKYYYFRHKHRLERLPGAPMSQEFMTRYHALLRAAEQGDDAVPPADDRRHFVTGTFGALVNDYLASGVFARRNRRRKKPTAACSNGSSGGTVRSPS